MTLENTDTPNPGEPSVDTPPAAPVVHDTIGLTRAEYQDLLAAASVGQQLSAHYQAQQAQQAQAQNHQPMLGEQDLDRLSNSQLLQFMQEQAVAPLLQQVVNLQVKLEVADCKEEFPDFKDFQNETIRIASENTSLSLRQAYLLAKASNGAPSTKQTPPANPATAPTPPPSLKPGPPPGATQPTGNLSTRDAALAALKELKFE